MEEEEEYEEKKEISKNILTLIVTFWGECETARNAFWGGSRRRRRWRWRCVLMISLFT